MRVKNKIATLLMLVVLSQLSACAVMSKKECLNANWQEIGYRVATDGNPDMPTEFNSREKACAKHGAIADWFEFSQGHSDGTVDYCQLSNAVDLGVIGRKSTIDDNVCPENDYPGFNDAFFVGYKLFLLKQEAYHSEITLSDLESTLYSYEKRISRLNNQLSDEELDKSEIKSIKQHRRQIKRNIHDVKSDIKSYENHLYFDELRVSEYADFLYQDYMLGLSIKYVDPRIKD